MSDIAHNLQIVQAKIDKVAKQWECDASGVNVIAVSKKQPEERIDAMLAAGQRIYGENRVQEAQERWSGRKAQYSDLELHLIGPLQTNKVKDAVTLFDVIQTIDRPKLAKAIAKEIKVQNKSLKLLIQVNTGSEDQKSGVLPEELPALLGCCAEEGLVVSGLMCIPPMNDPPGVHFAFLKKLADDNNLKELSMGMSSDFEKAIPLGATYIRVGTALFGSRN